MGVLKKIKIFQQVLYQSVGRKGLTLSLVSFLLLLALVPKVLSKPDSHALPLQFHIQLPPFSTLEVENLSVAGDSQTGQWSLTFPNKNVFPLNLKIKGPFGEELNQVVASAQELQSYKIPYGIESQSLSNPPTLSVLPQLCPRLVLTPEEAEFEGETPKFTYLGEKDHLNHRPTFQLLDSDTGTGKQGFTLSHMDGRNVLLVKQVRMSHDYEDSNHIEYQGVDKKTGEEKILKEDDRGFYANFQYAVVPYSPILESQNPQTLLHLGQGSLEKIEKKSLSPEMRTRSFIPGPYLSKKEYLYELCEWGDTAIHAKKQALNYQNLALWDWDYPVKEKDKVLLIVWESDEEHLDHNFKDLPKNYLIDDLIGVFVIDRKLSTKPLTLVNFRGDFQITVQTGNFKDKT